MTMGLMDGKIVLIFGIANKNSIAWGIAKRLHEEGATILISYAGEMLTKRVVPLAEEVGCTFVELCDVTDDAQLDAVFAKVQAQYGKIDTLIHCVAFANREDLGGRFVDVSRDGFKLAMDISAYSLIAMSKRAEPLMSEGSSILSLTYYASEKVMPKYHVMAIAKAALETITKYLANDLGAKGIRVNAISAGPIKTLAAAGVPGFRLMLKYSEKASPLRKLVTQEEVGDAALFLASDLSRSITGEIMHVDAGYNILGMTLTQDDMDIVNAAE
jgi:enoyl-[acyl-carrier protein] reductase I